MQLQKRNRKINRNRRTPGFVASEESKSPDQRFAELSSRHNNPQDPINKTH